MFDWAAYFKHLQLILLEYNLIETVTEPTMLSYFQEDLNSSILAKLQNKNLKLESFR